jgi:hypothetical protein
MPAGRGCKKCARCGECRGYDPVDSEVGERGLDMSTEAKEEKPITPEQKLARKSRALGEELGAFEERAVVVRWLKRMGYPTLAADVINGKHWEDPPSVAG